MTRSFLPKYLLPTSAIFLQLFPPLAAAQQQQYCDASRGERHKRNFR